MLPRIAPPYGADTKLFHRTTPTGAATAETRRGQRPPGLPPGQGRCVRAVPSWPVQTAERWERLHAYRCAVSALAGVEFGIEHRRGWPGRSNRALVG